MDNKAKSITEKEKDKHAFVIAPIGKEGSSERRRIDGIIKALLTPILQDIGFKPIASHEIDDSGSITS